jgi:hypothetical protein
MAVSKIHSLAIHIKLKDEAFISLHSIALKGRSTASLSSDRIKIKVTPAVKVNVFKKILLRRK